MICASHFQYLLFLRIPRPLLFLLRFLFCLYCIVQYILQVLNQSVSQPQMFLRKTISFLKIANKLLHKLICITHIAFDVQVILPCYDRLQPKPKVATDSGFSPLKVTTVKVLQNREHFIRLMSVVRAEKGQHIS